LFEISTTGKPTTETNDLIDEAIAAFDVITKVNAKKVKEKSTFQINVELEQTANQLIAESMNCSQTDKSIDYFGK
jgi:hypothetical protein